MVEVSHKSVKMMRQPGKPCSAKGPKYSLCEFPRSALFVEISVRCSERWNGA